VDVEILRTTIDLLLAAEKEVELGSLLSELAARMEHLSQFPTIQDPPQKFMAAISALREKCGQVKARLGPASWRRAKGIGADQYFDEQLVDQFAMTFTSTRIPNSSDIKNLGKYITQRKAYLSQLANISTGIASVGFNAGGIRRAEVGFVIPRQLFLNNLSGLVAELTVITRIVRNFSEIVTGAIEPIELRHIFSNDPTFFIRQGTSTIHAIASSFRRAAETWSDVEATRAGYPAIAQMRAMTPETASLFFESQIQSFIDSAVQGEIDRLSNISKNPTDDLGVPAAEIRWTVESIFSRVERGLRIEVRSPTITAGEAGDEVQLAGELGAIASHLDFPTISHEPVMTVPRIVEPTELLLSQSERVQIAAYIDGLRDRIEKSSLDAQKKKALLKKVDELFAELARKHVSLAVTMVAITGLLAVVGTAEADVIKLPQAIAEIGSLLGKAKQIFEESSSTLRLTAHPDSDLSAPSDSGSKGSGAPSGSTKSKK
jgi:hypothetical protein